MRSLVASLAVLAALVVAPPAAGVDREDDTPACVDAAEYNNARTFRTKRDIDAYLGTSGHRSLFSGESNPATGEPFPMRSRRYFKFIYEGCTGLMTVVYKRPDLRDPGRLKWLTMNYEESAYSAPAVARSR